VQELNEEFNQEKADRNMAKAKLKNASALGEL